MVAEKCESRPRRSHKEDICSTAESSFNSELLLEGRSHLQLVVIDNELGVLLIAEEKGVRCAACAS